MPTEPVGYLLSGLPGAGKSTYAKSLEEQGVVRLSVDELIVARHGRLGVDYPAAVHMDLAFPVIAEVRQALAVVIASGRSAVLDHGLGNRAERDDYKQLVGANGGTWRLLHFRVRRGELLRRLAVRNARGDVGVITAAMVDWMISVNEEPDGEGEEIIRPAGRG